MTERLNVKTSHKLILALLYPIVVLVGLAMVNSYELKTSKTKVLPIHWDQNQLDTMYGSILLFSINYEIDCTALAKQKRCPFKAHICLEPYKTIELSHTPNQTCTMFIKGKCLCGSVFSVEEDHHRFYIPEKHFYKIKQWIKNKQNKKEAVLSITKKGVIFIKDILINGWSLKKKIKTLNEY